MRKWIVRVAGAAVLIAATVVVGGGIEAVLLVPDLSARITLLGKDDKVITHLGEDPAWREQVLKNGMKLRGSKAGEEWVSGKFLHPHDACFDPAGNIFVAEWVHTGRITKLRRVS